MHKLTNSQKQALSTLSKHAFATTLPNVLSYGACVKVYNKGASGTVYGMAYTIGKRGAVNTNHAYPFKTTLTA